MARFVLISIPDNEEAEAFVAAMQGGHILYSRPHPTLEDQVSVVKPRTEWSAEALWADPTKMCECHPPWKLPNPIAKGSPGLQCSPGRSAKYGWLLCPQCNMPHPHQFQHPKNLLDPNETAQSRKYCLGFRSDRSAFQEGK